MDGDRDLASAKRQDPQVDTAADAAAIDDGTTTFSSAGAVPPAGGDVMSPRPSASDMAYGDGADPQFNIPYPFNGVVQNDSDGAVTAWNDQKTCYAIPPHSSTDRKHEDCDYVLEPATNTWFKVGPRVVTVDAGGYAHGWARAANDEEVQIIRGTGGAKCG